jgi:hypothetical protein
MRGEMRVNQCQKQGALVLAADVPGAPRKQVGIRGVDSQIPLMENCTWPDPGSSLSILIPASNVGTGQYVLVLCPDGIPSETDSEILYRFRMH